MVVAITIPDERCSERALAGSAIGVPQPLLDLPPLPSTLRCQQKRALADVDDGSREVEETRPSGDTPTFRSSIGANIRSGCSARPWGASPAGDPAIPGEHATLAATKQAASARVRRAPIVHVSGRPLARVTPSQTSPGPSLSPLSGRRQINPKGTETLYAFRSKQNSMWLIPYGLPFRGLIGALKFVSLSSKVS